MRRDEKGLLAGLGNRTPQVTHCLTEKNVEDLYEVFQASGHYNVPVQLNRHLIAST